MSDHITSRPPRQSPVRPTVVEPARTTRAARSAGGLVSIQQSLEGSTEPSGAVASTALGSSTAKRRAALRAAKPGELPGRARWMVHLANGEQSTTVNTHTARLVRCQRRVHSWADTLPRQTRQIRRANRTINIGPRMYMLTLTYKRGDDWQPNQIRDFMISLHQWLGDKLLAYSWVLEMQKRGAPHYHVLVYVKMGTSVPKPDKTGLWEYGSTQKKLVHTPFYICKYTSKSKQKVYQKEGFPAGARMFAVKVYSNDIPPEQLFAFRASAAPMWLREHLLDAYNRTGKEIRWSRVKGGGWLIKQTGEYLVSPWVITSVERIE